MKNGWQERSVGDILRLEYGKPLDESHRKPNGRFPVYGANGEKARTDKFYYDKPSIIVGRKGSAGEINLTENRFWPLDVTYFVTFDEYQHDLRFLYYLLTTLELTKLAKGVKPGINRNEVYSQGTKVPPLPEQKRIVGVLDETFERIATGKALAQKNLQNARALFESHLQLIFTPRGGGWVEQRLGDVADLVDCLHKTPTYAASGFPMVRVTDIKPGFLDLSKTRRVDEKTFIEFSKKRRPKVGDIVFSRVGSCGVSALVNTEDPFCLGQNTVFILPKINSVLLYYFLNSSNAQAQFEEFKDGTTQPTISLKSIREVRVPIPPAGDQDQLVSRLVALREDTQRLAVLYERKLAALEALKKSLLHKAFSGAL